MPSSGNAPLNRRYNPDLHHRRSIRLRGYDYTRDGAYYVTIVTHGRRTLFGDIVEGEMRLSEAGEMVKRVWDKMPDRFPNVEMDAFVVMPNHIHGIIIVGASLVGAQNPDARTTTRVAPTGGPRTPTPGQPPGLPLRGAPRTPTQGQPPGLPLRGDAGRDWET